MDLSGKKNSQQLAEPWLRGTLGEEPAVARSVLHALELAEEDVRRWCGELSAEELEAQPLGLPAVAFHVRHMARSVDRLLTYAEGGTLLEGQMGGLRAETTPSSRAPGKLLEEFSAALGQGAVRVRALGKMDLEQVRFVGRMRLPSTLGGLLVHVAEHTQRHAGQAITTAKVVMALRPGDGLPGAG